MWRGAHYPSLPSPGTGNELSKARGGFRAGILRGLRTGAITKVFIYFFKLTNYQNTISNFPKLQVTFVKFAAVGFTSLERRLGGEANG